MLVSDFPIVAAASRTRQIWLSFEYAVLFFGLAGVYALIGHPGSPVPILVLGAIGAVIYLRSRKDFDRRTFFRTSAIRGQLTSILGLWAIAATVILAALAVLAPDRLFELPRSEPLLWVFIMIFYPLFSVYPQELIFRGFLFHRYAPLFGTGNGPVIASAAAFGWVHIIYGQWLSVVLTTIAGALFARRYARTRSLSAVWLEHALYGLLAFTVGLGSFFYNGTR